MKLVIGEFIIYISEFVSQYYVYGLMYSETCLFGWISLTALSRTYFINKIISFTRVLSKSDLMQFLTITWDFRLLQFVPMEITNK